MAESIRINDLGASLANLILSTLNRQVGFTREELSSATYVGRVRILV